MTYQETINYLFEKLPMYQRQGPAAYKKDLTNIRALCEALEHPQEKFPAIHVAGTNGKGSVSHMVASIIQSAGYQTGLHTSPHYKDFRERIKVNGQMVPQEWVVDFVESHLDLIEETNPSFFEITTAMAFKYFHEQNVDMAIIEVGLGGRLDSTNILSPILSVITNIGYDHQEFLGNTLPEIAREKAGIIKHEIPVVIGEEQPATTPVFEEVAAQQNAPLTFTTRHYSYKTLNEDPSVLSFTVYKDGQKQLDHVTTDCPSHFQLKNVMTTLQAIDLLPASFVIPESAIQEGLKSVRQRTGLLGRWQILSRFPLTIADGAHNKEGIIEVVHHLKHLSYSRLHIVYGCVSDKQIEKLLPLFPEKAMFYFCEPAIDRKMPIERLIDVAEQLNIDHKTFKSVRQAFEAATTKAGEDDIIFIGGSIFVVAEMI